MDENTCQEKEKPVDKSALAGMLLRYEEQLRILQQLEASIARCVLQLGQTFVVGNVRARYSNAKRTYDYETYGRELASPEVIQQYTETETITKTDWRLVCKAAGIEVPGVANGTPTVKLIVGEE